VVVAQVQHLAFVWFTRHDQVAERIQHADKDQWDDHIERMPCLDVVQLPELRPVAHQQHESHGNPACVPPGEADMFDVAVQPHATAQQACQRQRGDHRDHAEYELEAGHGMASCR
jgi:hypothetical protein